MTGGGGLFQQDADGYYYYDAILSDEADNIPAAKLLNPVDLWFGMTVEFDFLMPKNGQMDGEDMIFDFHGDDDVFVYIDDVLVLDIGGTHGAESGTINFHTGEAEDGRIILKIGEPANVLTGILSGTDYEIVELGTEAGDLFADGFSITVTNTNDRISIDGNTYSAYWLMDVTYNEEKTAYAYTIADEFHDFVKAGKDVTVTAACALTTTNMLKKKVEKSC